MADLINPIKEAWNVMLHPSRTNTPKGLSFYYCAVVIPGILNAIIAALLIAVFPSSTFFASSGPLMGFIFILLIMFLGIPVGIVIDSVVVHLFAKLLFRVLKQPFNNTLTAMSYAMSPAIFFSWAQALPAPANAVAGIILTIWIFVLGIFLLSKTQQVSKLRALGAMLTLLIIPIVIILIVLLSVSVFIWLGIPNGAAFVTPSNANVSVTTTVRPSLTTTVRPSNANVSVTTTPSLVDTIPVGSGPSGIAIAPSGNYAYVTNWNNNTVSVINTSTNAVIKTISAGIGFNPYGIAITPNGNYAYVTNSNNETVSVINTTTNAVINIITVGFGPLGVAIAPSGNYAYVANSNNNTVSVINTTTNAVIKTISVGVGSGPYGSAGVGSGPDGIAITPNGNYAYVANLYNNTVSVINTSTNRIVDTIAVGSGPDGVAITPNGNYAYITNYNRSTVSVIRT